jgi:hypothetical protein
MMKKGCFEGGRLAVVGVVVVTSGEETFYESKRRL